MKKKLGYIIIAIYLVCFVGYFFLKDTTTHKISNVNVNTYKVKLPTKEEYDTFFDVNVQRDSNGNEFTYFADKTYTFNSYSSQHNVYLQHLPYTLRLYVLSKAEGDQAAIKSNNFLDYLSKSVETGSQIEKNDHYSIYRLDNYNKKYTNYNGIIYEDENIVMFYYLSGYYLDEDLTDSIIEEKVKEFIDSLYHLVIKDGQSGSYHRDQVEYNTSYQEAIESPLQITLNRKVGNALLININNPTNVSYQSIKIQGNFDGIYRNYIIEHIPQNASFLVGLEGPILSVDGVTSYTRYQNATFSVIEEYKSTHDIISRKNDIEITEVKDVSGYKRGMIQNNTSKVLYCNSYFIINDTLVSSYVGAEDDDHNTMLNSGVHQIDFSTSIANRYQEQVSEYWYLDSNYWYTGEISEDFDKMEFILGNVCEIVE